MPERAVNTPKHLFNIMSVARLEMWSELEYSYSNEKHGDIREDITQNLVQLMKQSY